eukprot:CAMPEP_0194298772 /NCGR_PEP_ID=MMETSP0169-20130528/60352_1 /TAXON_ID=218684 /ORGANISM="Corethron pennatum, Strain L29A3" /LENGTH=362 /DNA_ID=CAMNT_0039048795 /DNA_START=99 /DNA_END=1188 /DNA_ORIENTATION=-
MPSARLPLLFLLLLRSPAVSADQDVITDLLADVSNPFAEMDPKDMMEKLNAGQEAFNTDLLNSGLEDLVDAVPETIDLGDLPLPDGPFGISGVAEAVAEGIEESRGVAAVVLEEIEDYMSETLQADGPDVILPLDIVGAAVDAIEKFTTFAIDGDELMAQLESMVTMTVEELGAFDLADVVSGDELMAELGSMVTMTVEELGAFDLADVVSGMLEESVGASIFESVYLGTLDMAEENEFDLEALQATFAEKMEDLDPLDFEDLSGAVIGTVEDISGVEIDPEPLLAATRTLIDDPAGFDPSALTTAVAQAMAQETDLAEESGTVEDTGATKTEESMESGTARCARGSFLVVAVVLSLLGILA